MKKLLLVTSLLSIAMSEDIVMENHSRPKRVWIRDRQFKNAKRVQDDGPSDMQEFSYKNDRQFDRPRISDTRFVSEPKKLPSVAYIRRSDADKPKTNLNVGKPTILISIDIQERTKTNGDWQENCSTRKHYRRQNQGWQLQQPFYVDEPRWIEIDPDYMDGSSRHDGGDPYVLSRGKKIFWVKDPEQANKIAEDYEIPDYPSKSKQSSTKSRIRRSIEVDENDEKAHSNQVHQDKRLNNDENYVALDVKSKNSKRSAIPTNGKVTEVHRRYQTHQVDWMDANLDKEIKKNETDLFDDLSMYDDTFILSRGKKPSENESGASNRENINGKFTVKEPWKMDLYAHRNKLNDEEDKTETAEANDAAVTDMRLTSGLIGESEAQIALETKDRASREKRNTCANAACVSSQLQPDEEWLRSIEKDIQERLSLERRDKHRDILEGLQLSEPYVISRGKKTPRADNRNLYSALKSRMANEKDNRWTLNPPAARGLLRMLVMARSRCSDAGNCDVNTLDVTPNRQELAPRDRRGTLDEILAGYDPYYVVRGKRASLGKVFKVTSRLRSLWNQSDVLFDEDATRNDGLQ